MSFTPNAESISSHINRQEDALKDGSLPKRALYLGGLENGGVPSREGMLEVGAFRLSIDAMFRYLHTFARISRRIEKTFPDQDALVRVLPNSEIPVPVASMSFRSAYETFKSVQSQELRDADFFRGKRQLEDFKTGKPVSSEDLANIRDLLMKGARIATVCAGIDEAMDVAQSRRSVVQKGRDWLVDRTGSVGIHDSRIKAKLREMPFEEFGVRSLRIDADFMAQRLALSEDGSPAVREVSFAERQAANLLLQGTLFRDITLSRAGLAGTLAIRDQKGATVYDVSLGISEVFSALQLGASASRLLCELAEQKIGLVRLARFIHRPTALGLKICLDALPEQSHVRLSEVDSWAPRFETAKSCPLRDDERADLGALLLDAQQCLLVVAHLRVVTQTDEARSFWRRLWFESIRDRDVQAAQDMVNQASTPLECDCSGAAEVLGSAAMLLGYHAEDRTGAAWHVPENPVVSLTWAMTRAGDLSSTAMRP